MHRCTDAAKKR